MVLREAWTAVSRLRGAMRSGLERGELVELIAGILKF